MNAGLIIVEGNIGAGKSTFAKALAHSLHGKYIAEPDEKTNQYLADYYNDPARWSFEMQIHLLTRRYRSQLRAQREILDDGEGFYVMDRSYYGDVCFANVQKQLGYFDDRAYDTYLRLHTDLKLNLLPPTCAIFLDTSPAVCKSRISKRMSEKEGRKCESTIELDYLNRLDNEIRKLEKSLEGKTILNHLDWCEDKCFYEIKCRCNEIAVYIKSHEQSIYDFWTGTNGIGE